MAYADHAEKLSTIGESVMVIHTSVDALIRSAGENKELVDAIVRHLRAVTDAAAECR